MSVAKSDRFLVDGVNLATYLKSYSPSAQVKELDATVLASTWEAFEIGFKSGSLSAEGLFQSDGTNLDKIHDVFQAAINDGAARVITAGIGNFAVGSDAFMLDACQVGYDIGITVGEIIIANGSFRSTNGLNRGKWLASAQYNAGTNNGTVVDNGAATTNGGLFQGHLHNDTATTVVVKLQHSTTGVGAWVDLVTLATMSAVYDSASSVIAKGTTINRYTRTVITPAGGNTVLVSAALARRY